MPDSSYFLRSNSLEGLVSPAGPTGALHGGFEALSRRIAALSGKEAAQLFAEPVIAQGTGGTGPTASWYSPFDGEPSRLVDLDPDARARAEGLLRQRLQALGPALRDAERGMSVSQSLYIGSLDYIYVVNGQPVLTNWGFVPAAVAGSVDARRRHFAGTLGAFAPDIALPPITAEEWAESYGAPAVRPAEPAEQDTTNIAPSHPLHAAATAAPAAPAMAQPARPGGEAGAPVVYYVPWYRQAWFPLSIAVGVAALVLLYLLIPGVLLYPNALTAGTGDPPVGDDLRRKSNAALEDRIKTLRRAIEQNVCTAEGDVTVPGGVTPRGGKAGAPPDGGGHTPITPDALVPPDAGSLAVPPELPGAGPAAGPEDRRTVLDLLDRTTALVVAIGEKQSGTGSGFFVGPRTFVTNAHVVEGASPDKIFVVNQVFGKPVQARLLHVGQRNASGGGDYAVLEVDAPANQPFLSLASSVERLDNVIAGGFPAIILETDMDFQRLRKGDASAAPQMAVTQGVVTVVQKLPGGQSVVSHTATISPGNSGGPLVDSCGRVVGINTLLRADKLRTLYLALHAQSLGQFLGEKGISYSKRDDRCAPAVVPPVAAAPTAPSGGPASPTPPSGVPGGAPPEKK